MKNRDDRFGIRRAGWMKNRIILMLALVILAGCGGNSDREGTGMDPSFIWEADHSYISPASGSKHTWSGFNIEDHFFVSTKHRAKLIIWQKAAGKRKVSIRCVIEGKPVLLLVNDRKKQELIPGRNRVPVEFPAFLKKGFNLFEFKKQRGTRFRIESVRVGRPVSEAPPDLTAGGSVTAVVSPGTGLFKLKGKGKLEIQKVGFPGGEKWIDRKVLSGRRIKYPFSLESPGFVRMTCLSGYFYVRDYSFKRKMVPLEPPVLPEAGSPGIFIFLIDGCQQSHLGVYGYPRDTSPCIDELARDSVVFDNAYANATFTGSSVATIFTGLLPQRHKLKILINKLSEKHFLVTEFLKSKGYRTAVFSEAGNISPRFGFGQGVDQFPRLFFRVLKDQGLMERKLHQEFRDFTGQPGPLFVYLHFRAPHFPIIPPPPFLDMFKLTEREKQRGRRLIFEIPELVQSGHRFTGEEIADITDDYDSSIRYADHRIGRLIERLKERGLYEDSLMIFTSDHGEALNEHGKLGHGFNVYHETSLVPLIIKFPGFMNLKGRVDRVVSLTDIFPTIASLFGERLAMDGKSLFHAVVSREINDDIAISTSFHTISDFAVRWRDWYYLIQTKNNGEELYRLSHDPLLDVSTASRDVLLLLRGQFLNWLRINDQMDDAGETLDFKKLPADVLDHLRTLGYIE